MRALHDPLMRWCLAVTAPAAAYAALTLAALAALDCATALDPYRFCWWWSHSWLPTTLGLPATLAFGCWMSLRRRSLVPAAAGAVLIALTCLYLRTAAAHVVPYAA